MNLREHKKLSNDISLIKNDEGDSFLQFHDNGMMVKVKRGGYIPRSGLIFIDYLRGIDIHGDVLDIGTGETGLLANYAYVRGVKSITACDKDKDVINYIRNESEGLNKNEIKWVLGDVFNGASDQVFDFILSNPPQMPMSKEGSLHDYGGVDGRDIILKILEKAKDHLRMPDGKLFMLCFDFLGIMESFSSGPSISQIAYKFGLNSRIVASHKRVIRQNGKTIKSIPWINKIYPRYVFKKYLNGDTYHNIHIIELTISSS